MSDYIDDCHQVKIENVKFGKVKIGRVKPGYKTCSTCNGSGKKFPVMHDYGFIGDIGDIGGIHNIGRKKKNPLDCNTCHGAGIIPIIPPINMNK